MRDLELCFQRTERRIGGEHFYPVHLTNEELRILVHELFQEEIESGQAHLKILVRKDKGGKGIDLRLEERTRTPHQLVKSRLLSLGINANWRVVDFFEHYTQPAKGTSKVVGGKVYRFPGLVAQEQTGFQSQQVDEIYETRRERPAPPVRNAAFGHDGWTLVFEQAMHLTDV